MPIIEVDHVTKEFRLGQLVSLRQTVQNGWSRLTGGEAIKRQPFKALDDVSFSVEPGEVLGIIGHNGAGKSTLLKLLAGISIPTKGSVKVRGRVAPLIEVGAGLVPDLTGRENIYLNGAILGMRREEIKRKFDDIVGFAELEEFIDTPLKRYSSGMQVRLGFSIATSVESDILIIDEVLAVGDLAFQRKCFDRMETLIRKENRTVLLVSHNVRQVERICKRAILLDHGQAVADSDPIEVCERYFEISDRQVRANHGKSAESRRAAQESGEVFVREVTLLDESGSPTDCVRAGSDVIIRASLEARVDLSAPAFGFGVQTSDLFHIVHCESFEQISCERIPSGIFVVTCRISMPPLVPGVYSILMGIGAGIPSRTAYFSHGVASFQVTAAGSSRNQALRQGVIDANAKWSMDLTAASKKGAEKPESTLQELQ